MLDKVPSGTKYDGEVALEPSGWLRDKGTTQYVSLQPQNAHAGKQKRPQGKSRKCSLAWKDWENDEKKITKKEVHYRGYYRVSLSCIWIGEIKVHLNINEQFKYHRNIK